MKRRPKPRPSPEKRTAPLGTQDSAGFLMPADRLAGIELSLIRQINALATPLSMNLGIGEPNLEPDETLAELPGEPPRLPGILGECRHARPATDTRRDHQLRSRDRSLRHGRHRGSPLRDLSGFRQSRRRSPGARSRLFFVRDTRAICGRRRSRTASSLRPLLSMRRDSLHAEHEAHRRQLAVEPARLRSPATMLKQIARLAEGRGASS